MISKIQNIYVLIKTLDGKEYLTTNETWFNSAYKKPVVEKENVFATTSKKNT